MVKLLHVVIILSGIIMPAGMDSVRHAPAPFLDAAAQVSDIQTTDLELAQRYAPVFYFHPDEIYRPQPVEATLGVSRLRQNRRMWLDTMVLINPTIQDLFNISSDESYFLDQWFGDLGSSEYSNYSTHQAMYQSSLSPNVGGQTPLIYAHVVRSENPEYISIQYWIFYFYNDWFNKHEGDWEMVEVVLSAAYQPLWVVYSQHHGGVRRIWNTTPLEENTHPVVYVARGSHANYFAGNEIYPHIQQIGNQRITLMDRTGDADRLMPEVILIPTRTELADNPDGWPGAEWLMYRGRWGETGLSGDFSGPYGPADKGFQWEEPLAWGEEQPFDGTTWYKNRLEVVITAQSQAKIWLNDVAGNMLVGTEIIDNLAVMHAEPPKKVLAQIIGDPGALAEITISWPDCIRNVVTRKTFSGFVLDDAGQAQIELSADHAFLLSMTQPLELQPVLSETYQPVCDAPDTVSVGNRLNIREILWSFFLSLLYSLIPTMVFISILHWVDWYKKKPLKMLVITFVLGAIPALVIAFLVQLFFKIPPNLLGINALEAVRLGVLAPVIEETLKAVGVLFILWRFKGEIGDVLDGMIYGAIIGYGFASFSNLFRYVGNFIAWGYPALKMDYILVRTIHVLNHGLYTAIFGAILGFALTIKRRKHLWLWISAGLVLATGTHALQNLLSNSLVGLNVLTLIVTCAGTLVLWLFAGWSLVEQRRLLRTELYGKIQDTLYISVLDPLARAKAQWHALRRKGFRTWLQVRRLQRLCIKLAYLRLQSHELSENPTLSETAEAMQAQIEHIFNELRLAAK
jgi:RsiW-degrading membrane proteinase PrsW (M82 family)